MTMLLNVDPVLEKFQYAFEIFGVRSKMPNQKSDFEYVYRI